MPENIMTVTNHAGIGNNIALTRQRQQFARLQNQIFIAHGDKFFVSRQEFLISAAPRIRTPIGRVFKALHTDFVAVINAGYAGISHLPKSRHF